MKDSRLTKARETRTANAAKFAAQTVNIDKDWKIVRTDEMNWEIRHKGRFQGYYGSLRAALRALPVKMLDDEARASLAAIEANFLIILHKIDAALPS